MDTLRPAHVPALPYGCNSWVVTRKSTGEVVGEFYDWRNVAIFDPDKALIETAADYLDRINEEIKA
jgi:hypothetical protein